MKILLVNPPWRGKDYAVRAGSRWAHSHSKNQKIVSYRPFPFYLGSAAALLEKNHTVGVIDALAQNIPENEFLKQVEKFKPDLVFSEIATPSYHNDMWFMDKIKQITNAKIVLGGQHVSALPDKVVKNKFVDHALIGEYEFLLKNIVDSKSKKPKEKIIRVKELVDINKIPWPARHMFDMSLYNEPFCNNYPNIQMLASRGCYYRCSYCTIFMMYGGRNYRFRNPSDILDEIEHCIEKYNPKEFYFDDDLVNGKPDQLEKFCEQKIKRKIDIPFSAMAHSKITKQTLKLMKRAGCTALKFGVESSSDDVLKQLGKGITIDSVKKAVKNCKDLGIRTHLTYAIGLPGDTEKKVKDTIRFAMEYGDSYQISICTPYPGTPYFETAKQNGWLRYDSWQDFDGAKGAIVDLPTLSAKQTNKLYELGKNSVYRKFLQSGEFTKLIKMAYQEGGMLHLAKLSLLRGPGIAKAVIESKLKL